MAELHKRSIQPAWPIEEMIEHCKNDICFGINDPLCAFIILRQVADQAEILTIVTHPNFRKNGFARELLGAAEDFVMSNGGDIIFLEVAEDNAEAIALYKSNGFRPFGRRPGYYKRPNGRVAALTFRKRLDA